MSYRKASDFIDEMRFAVTNVWRIIIDHTIDRKNSNRVSNVKNFACKCIWKGNLNKSNVFLREIFNKFFFQRGLKNSRTITNIVVKSLNFQAIHYENKKQLFFELKYKNLITNIYNISQSYRDDRIKDKNFYLETQLKSLCKRGRMLIRILLFANGFIFYEEFSKNCFIFRTSISLLSYAPNFF